MKSTPLPLDVKAGLELLIGFIVLSRGSGQLPRGLGDILLQYDWYVSYAAGEASVWTNAFPFGAVPVVTEVSLAQL